MLQKKKEKKKNLPPDGSHSKVTSHVVFLVGGVADKSIHTQNQILSTKNKRKKKKKKKKKKWIACKMKIFLVQIKS